MVSSLRTPNVLDLKTQFSFYASYHHDHSNQMIHFLCIWPILFSALVLLNKTTPFIKPVKSEDDKEGKVSLFNPNWGYVI